MKLGDLERVYENAGGELRTILLSLNLENFDSAKAEEVRRKTRRIVAYLRVFGVRWARAITRVEYEKAEKRAVLKIERRRRDRPRGPKPTMPGHDRVRKITDDVLVRATDSITRTVNQYLAAAFLGSTAIKSLPVQEFDYDEYAEDVGRLSRKAVKKEWSRGTLQKQILERLRRIYGEANFIAILGKDGIERNYNIRKYAKMVARTTLRDSQTAATLDICKRYENDLVQVSEHGTQCEICGPYEGNTYSISGNHPKYPPLPEGGPTWHPNCLHSVLPISEEEIYIRGLGI